MMDVYLTDVGKAWLQDHYPQGIVWEYARAGDIIIHSPPIGKAAQ